MLARTHPEEHPHYQLAAWSSWTLTDVVPAGSVTVPALAFTVPALA
jgi:hypothetical protein